MFPASSELKSEVNQGQKRRKMARQMFQRTRDKRGKTLLERGSFTRSWNRFTTVKRFSTPAENLRGRI